MSKYPAPLVCFVLVVLLLLLLFSWVTLCHTQVHTEWCSRFKLKVFVLLCFVFVFQDYYSSFQLNGGTDYLVKRTQALTLRRKIKQMLSTSRMKTKVQTSMSQNSWHWHKPLSSVTVTVIWWILSVAKTPFCGFLCLRGWTVERWRFLCLRGWTVESTNSKLVLFSAAFQSSTTLLHDDPVVSMTSFWAPDFLLSSGHILKMWFCTLKLSPKSFFCLFIPRLFGIYYGAGSDGIQQTVLST